MLHCIGRLPSYSSQAFRRHGDLETSGTRPDSSHRLTPGLLTSASNPLAPVPPVERLKPNGPRQVACSLRTCRHHRNSETEETLDGPLSRRQAGGATLSQTLTSPDRDGTTAETFADLESAQIRLLACLDPDAVAQEPPSPRVAPDYYGSPECWPYQNSDFRVQRGRPVPGRQAGPARRTMCSRLRIMSPPILPSPLPTCSSAWGA